MSVKIFKPPIKNIIVCDRKCLHSWKVKNELLVGRKKHIYQALIQFDLSALPLFVTILHGTLNIHLIENYFPRTDKILAVHQVLSSCSRKKLLYNPAPVASAIISNVISFDITPLVFDWHSGSAENFGVLLKLINEMLPGHLEIYSGKAKNSAFWPFLEISLLEPLPPPESPCHTLDFDCTVTARNYPQTTATLNTQCFDYTYYIINSGTNNATVSLQLSPDGTNWLSDDPQRVIEPGTITPLIPASITRFTRITYQSTDPTKETVLQIQVRGYSS